MKKIQTIETLGKLCRVFREDMDKFVGLCHGCWDILHIGHVQHLRAAKKGCDILIVTVTADRFVNKGFDQPVFDAETRAEVLSELSCVDFVAINDNPTAVEAIRSLHPDVYFKGVEFQDWMPDRTPGLASEVKELYTHGGRIDFIGETLGSSTKLASRLK